MNCQTFEQRLQRLLDRRRRPERDFALRRHARYCAQCHALLRAQTFLFPLLANPAFTRPTGLLGETGDSAVDRHSGHNRQPAACRSHDRRTLMWASGSAAVAVSVCAIVIGVWYLLPATTNALVSSRSMVGSGQQDLDATSDARREPLNRPWHDTASQRLGLTIPHFWPGTDPHQPWGDMAPWTDGIGWALQPIVARRWWVDVADGLRPVISSVASTINVLSRPWRQRPDSAESRSGQAMDSHPVAAGIA